MKIHQISLLLAMAMIPQVHDEARPPKVAELPAVHLASQARHAHELAKLRQRLHISTVSHFKTPLKNQKPLSPQQMSQLVFETVEGSLKGRWKSQAFRIASEVIDQANQYAMDPFFLLAVITQESHFDPRARGSHNEVGLMQMKPATAQWLRETGLVEIRNLYDPTENIRAGAAYLHLLRQNFAQQGHLYLPAYNMGPGSVKAFLKLNFVPQRYSHAVMRHYVATIDTKRNSPARPESENFYHLALHPARLLTDIISYGQQTPAPGDLERSILTKTVALSSARFEKLDDAQPTQITQ